MSKLLGAGKALQLLHTLAAALLQPSTWQTPQPNSFHYSAPSKLWEIAIRTESNDGAGQGKVREQDGSHILLDSLSDGEVRGTYLSPKGRACMAPTTFPWLEECTAHSSRTSLESA